MYNGFPNIQFYTMYIIQYLGLQSWPVLFNVVFQDKRLHIHLLQGHSIDDQVPLFVSLLPVLIFGKEAHIHDVRVEGRSISEQFFNI